MPDKPMLAPGAKNFELRLFTEHDVTINHSRRCLLDDLIHWSLQYDNPMLLEEPELRERLHLVPRLGNGFIKEMLEAVPTEGLRVFRAWLQLWTGGSYVAETYLNQSYTMRAWYRQYVVPPAKRAVINELLKDWGVTRRRQLDRARRVTKRAREALAAVVIVANTKETDPDEPPAKRARLASSDAAEEPSEVIDLSHNDPMELV
jgi:hypothetical protein